MEALGVSPTALVSFIVAVGFASGLNVYATICALGLMARMHWVVLPPGLESLDHVWIVVISGALFAVEFVADKIPGLDLVWNALHTFVRIPAAVLIAFAAGSQLSPETRLLATIAGAAVATLAHGSKTAARIAVTPSPEPVSNIGLSTAEDGVAVGLAYLATHFPMLAGGLVVALCLASIALIWLSANAVLQLARRWFGAGR